MDGEAPPVRRSLKSKPSASSAKQAWNCTVRGEEGNEQGTSWVFEGCVNEEQSEGMTMETTEVSRVACFY